MAYCVTVKKFLARLDPLCFVGAEGYSSGDRDSYQATASYRKNIESSLVPLQVNTNAT